MKTYFIQNGYSGNAMCFWAKNGRGYTSDIDNAEEFTKEEAIDTIRHAWGSHNFKMWDAAVVRQNATLCAIADKIPQGVGYRPKRKPKIKK